MKSRQDGTAEGLLNFLEWTVEEGLLKKATANAYRAAVGKVLESIGEDWERAEVRELDLGTVFERFMEESGDNYSEPSLRTYRGRFEKAVEMYLDYLESPSLFRPSIQKRNRFSQTIAEGRVTTPADVEADAPPPTPTNGVDLIEYAFPLQDGNTAYLRLPRYFAREEVERMTKFLAALAMDPPVVAPAARSAAWGSSPRANEPLRR